MKSRDSLVELNKFLGVVTQEKQRRSVPMNDMNKRIIMMHLEGYTYNEIALELSLPPHRVINVIRADNSQNIINQLYEFQDTEYKALYRLAVSAVRDCLQSENEAIRLRAADMYMKAHGKAGGGAQDRETAEDIVSRMIEYSRNLKSGTETLKVSESRKAK